MVSLIATTYQAASVATQRDGRASSLILAAGQDPSPESVTAAKEAYLQSEVSLKVLKKSLEAAQQQGSALASAVAAGTGIGQNLNLMA